MAKKVVPYSRPVIDKLSIKLTETYILAFVNIYTIIYILYTIIYILIYIQTLKVKG